MLFLIYGADRPNSRWTGNNFSKGGLSPHSVLCVPVVPGVVVDVVTVWLSLFPAVSIYRYSRCCRLKICKAVVVGNVAVGKTSLVNR